MDSEMIMIVSIVAIACATGLIKNWMKYRFKESVDKERFERLAQAFIQHKKEMRNRITNIESALADEKERKGQYSQIEIDESERKRKSVGEGRLTNNLRNKTKVKA